MQTKNCAANWKYKTYRSKLKMNWGQHWVSFVSSKIKFQNVALFWFNEANEVYYFEHGRLQFYHINVPLRRKSFEYLNSPKSQFVKSLKLNDLGYFDPVFQRPYRYFSIDLKVILSLSDRYKIFTNDWL